ncbi:uncharacterized protein [Amphiura filiformis]|uniref:uncharacterized protein n=1 Tax=Amphiura filiformis TaxID=82378 RepID=UPI003B225E9E
MSKRNHQYQKPQPLKRTKIHEQVQHETEQVLRLSSQETSNSPEPNSSEPRSFSSGQKTSSGQNTTDLKPNAPGPSNGEPSISSGPRTSPGSDTHVPSISGTNILLGPNASGPRTLGINTSGIASSGPSTASGSNNVLSKLQRSYSEPSRPTSSMPVTSPGPNAPTWLNTSTAESAQPRILPGQNSSPEVDTSSSLEPSASSGGSSASRGSLHPTDILTEGVPKIESGSQSSQAMVQIEPSQFDDVINQLLPAQLTKLFHQLGLRDIDIKKAKLSCREDDVDLQAREVFILWVEINGPEATCESVLEALKRCRFMDAYRKIEKKWKLKRRAYSDRNTAEETAEAGPTCQNEACKGEVYTACHRCGAYLCYLHTEEDPDTCTYHGHNEGANSDENMGEETNGV